MVRSKNFILCGVAIFPLIIGTGFAQSDQNQTDGGDYEEEVDSITVEGSRIQGATLGNIEPDISITAEEIQSYGVSSFEELLTVLEPLTSSGRGRAAGGRPIILLNGQRIANFREIRRYPPEALLRVDILPEDVAVQYGYRADQRVVNFVLKPGFKSRSAEFEFGGPTEGDRVSTETELGWLQLGDMRRTSIDGEYETSSSLLESDRDIISTFSSFPNAIDGNVTGQLAGGEIDPALSGLFGDTVTIAGFPSANAGALTLDDFLEFANNPKSDDETAFTTLLPETEEISLNATHNRSIGDGVALTVSAGIDASSSTSLLGLVPLEFEVPSSSSYSPFSEDVTVLKFLGEDHVRERKTDSIETSVSATLDGNYNGWRYNVISNYSLTNSKTTTDREADPTDINALLFVDDLSFNPFAQSSESFTVLRDRVESETDTLSLDATLNGAVGRAPAGEITTTLRGSLSSVNVSTSNDVGGEFSQIDLTRNSAVLRSSFDIPISSRREEVLDSLGDLSFDVRGEIEDLSDVGTLSTYGSGVRWSPIEKLRLSGSWRQEDGAPSVSQLGSVILDTPNVRIFDFTTGETVEVVRRSGANPDLMNDSRQVLALGARVELRENGELTLSADYTDEKIKDPISSFPTLTPEIEAAFPERVFRENGELVFVDARAVNFQEQNRRELRTSLNFRKRIEPKQTEARRPRGGATAPDSARRDNAEGRSNSQSGDAQRQNQSRAPQGDGDNAARSQNSRRPSAGGGRGPRSALGGRSGGGFVSLSLNHTWALEETILIRDGLPELDLLDGSATSGFGGTPEHKLSARLFTVNNGIGAGANWNWQSATFVEGGLTSDDLDFSSFSTTDARVFLSFDQRKKMIEKFPFLKGSRVRLSIDNVFDQRIEVTDSAGIVPISYQPFLNDPLGRQIELSFRKLFY